MQNATARAVSALFKDAYPNSYIGIGVRQQNTNPIIIKKWVRVSDIESYFNNFEPHQSTDLYCTSNTFRGGFHKRTVALHRHENTLLSVNNIVIDTDIHDSNESSEQQRKILKEYIKDVDRAVKRGDMPPYHACVFTGRGLQFWYTIQPLAAVCRSLVQIVLKKLISAHETVKRQESNIFKYGFYDDLSVDASASQRMTGFFRLPFTYNTAVNLRGKVHIVDNYTVPHINNLLSFFGVTTILKPQKTAKRKEHGTVTTGTRQPRYFPLLTKRRAILENIDIGLGRREVSCFLYYNTIVQIYENRELARKALERFNANLSYPLRASQLRSIERAVDKIGFYQFKESTFYETAQISPEELEVFSMKYMPPSVAKREAERAEKRRLKAERNDIIRKLALEGKKYDEIEQMVNVSRKTIAKIIAPNKAINTTNARKDKQMRQIAADLEAGKSRKDIAASLGISSATLARRIAEMRKQGFIS